MTVMLFLKTRLQGADAQKEPMYDLAKSRASNEVTEFAGEWEA